MSATLKLNANYMPIEIISHRDAVCLVLAGKAIQIEGTGRFYHSKDITVEVPSVVVLKRMANVPYTEVQCNRRNILARDNHECQLVGFDGCTGRGTTIDHVHPRSKGGRHIWTNVVAACEPCNAKKADRTLGQLGWKLKRKPKAPPASQWMLSVFNPPEEWEPYIQHLVPA